MHRGRKGDVVREVIALEQAIGFGMADDRLDGVPSAKLAADCG